MINRNHFTNIQKNTINFVKIIYSNITVVKIGECEITK